MKKNIFSLAVFYFSLSVDAAAPLTVDLISPANCKTAFRQLYQCKFVPSTLGLAGDSAGIPFKTTVKTLLEGDCSTALPLQLEIVPTKDPHQSQTLSILLNRENTVRAADKNPLGEFLLRDPNPKMTLLASFSESCRISIEITPDQPDFKNKQDALETVSGKMSDMIEADESSQAFSELLSYQALFGTMQRIAKLFHQQITSQYAEEITRNGKDLKIIIEKMRKNGSLSLNQAELNTLESMTEFLEIFEVPSKWKGKKFKDFFSVEDQKLIDTLSKNVEKRELYENNFKKSNERKVNLCQELTRMRLALKQLLSDSDWKPFISPIQRCESR